MKVPAASDEVVKFFKNVHKFLKVCVLSENSRGFCVFSELQGSVIRR